ncbi:MAG: SDR family oxidoreductase [Gammaproteobacteria bacterium]|nr:SDR family oxidoreductase [Gammaproteobacteria bacterium]
MQNKKILITGAGSGLGKALSLWLSELGVDLCLLSRSIQKLEDLQMKMQRPARIYAIDFEDAVDLDKILSKILGLEFIPEVIIHCAGGGFKMHSPWLSRAEFEKLAAINLASVIQINHHFIPKMLERKAGVLIHIASTAAMAAHGSVAYNTVKAGLAAYVRSLGRELAATGVVATGFCPGSFIAAGNNMAGFLADKPAEFKNYAANLPAGKMSRVEDFFPLVKMLCEQTSALFSGCMLPADAGEGMAYLK